MIFFSDRVKVKLPGITINVKHIELFNKIISLSIISNVKYNTNIEYEKNIKEIGKEKY